jgi:hypothetical protein
LRVSENKVLEENIWTYSKEDAGEKYILRRIIIVLFTDIIRMMKR